MVVQQKLIHIEQIGRLNFERICSNKIACRPTTTWKQSFPDILLICLAGQRAREMKEGEEQRVTTQGWGNFFARERRRVELRHLNFRCFRALTYLFRAREACIQTPHVPRLCKFHHNLAHN